MHVPLDANTTRRDLLCLPWGSILKVHSGGMSFSILTGPACYHGRWMLPIWERNNSEDKARLAKLSAKFRQQHALDALIPRGNLPKHKTKPAVRALTIKQPWAYAMLHLGKDVENRSWRRDYSGPLLIHTSKHPVTEPRALLAKHMRSVPSINALNKLPTGSVVGVADLCDYVRDSQSKWAQKRKWHWLLRNVHPIRPIKCPGQLGLWTPTRAIINKLPVRIREKC